MMPLGARPRARLPAFALVVLVAVFALAGCGGSSSSASSAQLEAAKKEGEETAHEKDRINSLQKQVRGLKHRAKHQSSTIVVEHGSGTETAASEGAGPTVLRTFHAPSGNVSCEILSNGALCSVESIDETFVFGESGTARLESGASLPRAYGPLAPYGTTVSAGSVTCTVPPSDSPHGIVCSDAESGHGFEASRVPNRQHVY